MLGYMPQHRKVLRHRPLGALGGPLKEKADRSGVVVLPPLLMLGALILVLVLHHFWALNIGAKALATVLGAVLCVLGVASAAWGRIVLVRAGTNVSPLKPSTAIVTSGPYRFTRNPLYVGIISVFIGLSLIIGTWWGFVMLIPAVLILHNGVVLREERYLERKFGHPYLKYKRAVRRYI